VFVTHGIADAVLPIDRCSRRLVPALRGGGYDVVYEEFDGGHAVPRELAHRAIEWMLDG
jgi:phospholipase/carboxylesterase